MLRIAVPNKGSLSESAAQMLRESGYRQRTNSRDLVLADPANDAEFFFLRPRDIAVYVGSGTLDVGVTGRDLLLDSEADAEEVLALGFGRSTFRFAAPIAGGAAAGSAKEITAGITMAAAASQLMSLSGRRIATSYPGLVRRYLTEHAITADVVRLDGAVESSVGLGVADVIADVVDTGSTLRAAGLQVLGEPILESEAILIRRLGAPADPAVAVLQRRLEGVLVARQYVMLDYDVRVDLVEQACELTPGLESPTVSPLQDKQWVAVRAMVPRSNTHHIMDELYEVGARAILVTDIHACRL